MRVCVRASARTCVTARACVLVRVLTVFSDTKRCIAGWQISFLQLFIRPRWVMADTCLSHAEQLTWKLMFHISDHLFLLRCRKAERKIVFVLRHACVFFSHVCYCNWLFFFFFYSFESYKHGTEWLKCIMTFCCFWVGFLTSLVPQKTFRNLTCLRIDDPPPSKNKKSEVICPQRETLLINI